MKEKQVLIIAEKIISQQIKERKEQVLRMHLLFSLISHSMGEISK